MSTTYLPDEHPGRCINRRNGARCLDYDAVPHVCSFPPSPQLTHTFTTTYMSTAKKPVPWVKPRR